MVEMKCRDRWAKRRAMELMRRYPRWEGKRDSVVAAAIVSWVMETEGDGVVGEVIPEEKRLKVVRAELTGEESKVLIVCSKFVEGSDEREELPEALITW